MSVTEFLLFIIFGMNATLAGFVAWSDRRNPANRSFAVFTGAIALWSGLLIVFRQTENAFIAILALKGTYVAAAAIASSFYAFIHYFPERLSFLRWERILFAATTIAVPLVILLPGVLITGVAMGRAVRAGIQEPLGYWLFAGYFLAYFFGSLAILYRTWRRLAGGERTKLGYILWSVAIAGLLGAYFNLAMPSPFWGEWRFTWSGPMFTALIVFAVSYAMTAHGLFNARVVATAVFAAALSLALLFDIFLPTPFLFRIVKTALFAAVTVTGYLLVQSVRREIAARERISTLAAELASANAELKQLDAAKSEFISIAGHQLRAPLTIIKGYVSMLLEGTLGPASDLARESMKKVFVSTGQLVRLIGDLLDLSRIETGRMRYEMTRVRLADIVADVVRQFEAVSRAKGLLLLYQNRSTGDVFVNGDPDKLRETVVNLVDNAIKYTARGRVVAELYAEKRAGRRWLTLKVEDSGIGIKAADIARMFTKFARTEEAKRLRPDGMGLGLYIVKKIIEDHGGEASVASRGLGQGSTFSVILPAL